MGAVSATGTWRNLLGALLQGGDEVVVGHTAGSDFKGRTTRELLACRTMWPMSRPAVTCPARKLGYRFMAGEAAWVLSGDNRLATIQQFAKHMARFSDDGRTLSGAYGPPFVEQAGWVARTLAADRRSRQAVATIWRPRPGPSKDTPCTVALQWVVRRGGAAYDLLHCVATMRSSDAWTGVPYDVFTFSMMSAYVAIAVRDLEDRGEKTLADAPVSGGPRRPLLLGTLFLTAGSQHLYKQDWDDAWRCLSTVGEAFAAAEVPLHMFGTTERLVGQLFGIATSDEPQVWLADDQWRMIL